MQTIVNKIQKLSISSKKIEVGNIVQTPYGIGKVIAHRINHSRSVIVVKFEYGTAYLNISDIKLYN